MNFITTCCPWPLLGQSSRYESGPDPSTQQTQTTATLVRAIFEGNWNPEPLAVDLFASKFAVKRGVGVNVVRHALAGIDKLSPAPDLVMVCGVERHEFSPAQTTAITEYIQAGGVILFETPGGRGEFTLSAEEMATTAFSLPIPRKSEEEEEDPEGYPITEDAGAEEKPAEEKAEEKDGNKKDKEDG